MRQVFLTNKMFTPSRLDCCDNASKILPNLCDNQCHIPKKYQQSKHFHLSLSKRLGQCDDKCFFPLGKWSNIKLLACIKYPQNDLRQ